MIGEVDTELRSRDGTLLPPTLSPDTGDRHRMAALPLLERTDTARDLEIGATIGEGGMGLVRLAQQLAIGRPVAVKVLRPDRADPAHSLHLLREAWITGALEHPNIIPIYSVGVDAAGNPMIVMKRIEGTPWTAYIYDGEHDLRWHLGILIQVSNAIDFAGSRGVIHRDLKPDNVMIGSFGEVYVLDWGIAVSIEDDHGGRLPLARDVRGVCGTPGYLAPEMVRPTGDQLSVRTDVYLLGALLHELITKEKRHTGGSLQAVLLSSMESTPHPYEPHIPAELADIANRATHLDPDERFQTAGELREALERFLSHQGSRELTDQAQQRLDTWTELEAREEQPDPIAVTNLFGEARFGFQQALRAWPDNERAQRGLLECLEKKFEHDLRRDDFESASVVLAEMRERRSDLTERLETLRVRMERRRAELGELRRLQASRDLNVGRRTRAFLMILTGFMWGLVPPFVLVLRGFGFEIGYGYLYLTGVIKLVDAVGLTIWARDSLTKTAVNRQLTATLFLLILCEIVTRPFAQRLGHPIEHALMLDFGLYFLVDATLALTVDRRLAYGPLIYAAGAILAYCSVENVFWFLGAAHFCAFMLAAWVWRPAKIRGDDVTVPRTQ